MRPHVPYFVYFNGLVGSMESLLLIQATLHNIHFGTDQTPEELVDMMETGRLYPPIDFAVDARAVYDAIAASDVCDPRESSLKFHLISTSERLFHGILRCPCWLFTCDVMAGGPTKGGMHRTLLHAVSEMCFDECKHGALAHRNCVTKRLGLSLSSDS